MKKKKAYEAPTFKRVRLDVKTSVLGVCALSVGATPADFGTCKFPTPGNCYD